MRPEDDDDRALREQFARLRAEDARETPDFQILWERAIELERAGARRGRWWWVLLPAGALAILTIAVLVDRARPPAAEVVLDAEITIADWTTASTDWLGLDDVGFLELGGESADRGDGAEESWQLPSDALLEQAESELGQEREI